ncbi:MAG TPA: c-type cytochrome [Kofleriaceae bacterium]|nr:c-type cytochrome [Kofleriaceae bacterium]
MVGFVFAIGCGTDPATGDDDGVVFPYPELPADTQRPGDAAKGYDFLINGGYITCGIPKSIAPSGSAADRMAGRTGDNAALPYYWSAATSAEGVRVVSANCMFCHAGKINDQLVIGLGAADRDFTGDQVALLDTALGLVSGVEKTELERFRDRMAAIADYSRTITIGVNPADSLTAALFSHRDPATLAWSAEPMIPLPPAIVPPVDVPPWWRMSKKHTMFYNAAGRGDHARIMMAASLLCTENVAEAQMIDQAFVDVRAWIESSVQPPAWPFGAVDTQLVAKGKTVFEATCAKCHGTYGEGGVYPNQLVPLADIGTDSTLVEGENQFAGAFVEWFAASFWGQTSRLEPSIGYVAPPLDGVWATAPFLHNGSVPTIEALLDSSKRPKYWTRTFQSTDYDPATLGWKFTKLDHGHAGEPTAGARVKIYDTTQAGYGNGGHTFGDDLSDSERKAVLEYLKTL